MIRRFEEKVEERFRAGELPGLLHVAIGQEAVAVGVCRALEDGDVIASTHRAHGHTLAKGTTPNELMAELYGKLFFFQAEDGIRDADVTGVQTCALPISGSPPWPPRPPHPPPPPPVPGDAATSDAAEEVFV